MVRPTPPTVTRWVKFAFELYAKRSGLAPAVVRYSVAKPSLQDATVTIENPTANPLNFPVAPTRFGRFCVDPPELGNSRGVIVVSM
jgi:hypothetical protein